MAAAAAAAAAAGKAGAAGGAAGRGREREPEVAKSAASGGSAKRPRVAAAAAAGEQWPVRDNTLGLSLAAMRALSAGANGRTVEQMWAEEWIHQTVPLGWKVNVVYGGDSERRGDGRRRWLKDVYTNVTTGERLTKTPKNRYSFIVPPSTCATLLDAHPELLESDSAVGRPTHYVSYPWTMFVDDLLDTLGAALAHDENPYVTAFVYTIGDVHQQFDPGTAAAIAAKRIGDVSVLVQTCTDWTAPELATRLWPLYEACCAVTSGVVELKFALPAHQQRIMADRLIREGPDVVLDIVYRMAFDPHTASYAAPQDKVALIPAIEKMFVELGKEKIVRRLRQTVRRAYASAIENEFDLRWDALVSDLQCAPGVDDYSASEMTVLDLGHQLGCLWSLTNAVDRAKTILLRVVGRLKKRGPCNEEESNHVARLDRTAAELVKMLKLGGQTAEAHKMECLASHDGNELPVSWNGPTIDYLQQFQHKHRHELDFLSTDATVERIIKPQTANKLLGEPVPTGRALIEMVHSQCKTQPKFFLSHAWRQTFSVSTAEWRGGLVEAVVHSVRCEQCKERQTSQNGNCASCITLRQSTGFWFDIFCVNQHLRSPYGGLLAFAFDPLRNAMIQCDIVKLFLETWDDPAPLGRVWCLDELRTALLLGKPVEVIMPPQALRSFRAAAEKAKDAVLEDIERVVTRIDINHASASFREDRDFVLNRVETTLGTEPLNNFCREIFRAALLEAAGLADPRKQSDRDDHWREIFEDLLAKARDASTKIPQVIEIERAVAMMQRRIYQSDKCSSTYEEGTQLLRDVEVRACQFYGEGSELHADLARQLSSTS